MKFQHLFLVVVLMGFGTLLAKEVWQEKPYTEWTKKEVVAILTDSPWAVRQSVGFGGTAMDLSGSSPVQREGSGTSIETMDSEASGSSAPRIYIVRFVSAQPVRMAISRWAVLSEKILPTQAQAMLSQNPYKGTVVVSVSASNDQDWSELNTFSTQDLEEANYVRLKQSKRKIFAERYVPPLESGVGEALFYFSRTDGETTLVTPSEKEVTFNCRLSVRTSFRTKFKLKKMIFNDELAI